MRLQMNGYPRPQLVREHWESLNGIWDFLFDDNDTGERMGWFLQFPTEHQQILVPYSCESKRSGIQDDSFHPILWYHRTITISCLDSASRTLLHFEGSDFTTKVWVNGNYLGSHRGGYARFSFDITNCLHDGENSITVKIEDTNSLEQPRGKQRWLDHNYDCWYPQTTGIWKSVWMETVPDTYICSIKMTPVMEYGRLEFELGYSGEIREGMELEVEILFEDQLMNRVTLLLSNKKTCGNIDVCPSRYRPWEKGVHVWTPENPQLYDVVFKILENETVVDEVLSYFGMRDIRVQNGKILLNGSPLYQKLLLDQGYWADTLLTPPDDEALISDIEKVKALGFNGVRKHMKTEDERFLFLADVKGLLVWSEMAAFYEYSDQAAEEYTREWMDVVRQNYNHPSVITWVPFNESWGVPQVMSDPCQQSFVKSIYYLTKSFDPMRPVVTNDGWEHLCSDIITLHDYEPNADAFSKRYAKTPENLLRSDVYFNNMRTAFAESAQYSGQPVIISEYGGIAFTEGQKGSWGYGRTEATQEAFLERFAAITKAIMNLPFCQGFCYTQLTDVCQEINGLLDDNHQFKIEPEKIREIIAADMDS